MYLIILGMICMSFLFYFDIRQKRKRAKRIMQSTMIMSKIHRLNMFMFNSSTKEELDDYYDQLKKELLSASQIKDKKMLELLKSTLDDNFYDITYCVCDSKFKHKYLIRELR